MAPDAPTTTSVNIASHLPAMARQQPDTLAVAFPLKTKDGQGQTSYEHWTYKQLNDESDRIARGLQQLGITKGTRTVLMVKPSPEFFALVFAIFKTGAVMIGVDPGMGIKNLKQCLAEAEPHAFIGIRKAHTARKLLGWAKKTIRINILVGKKLFPFGSTVTLDRVRELGDKESSASNKPVLVETTPDDTAAILFTSGSTGVPKGVVYTHGNFDAQVRALISEFNIEPGEVDLCTFPLFALYAPAMGMTAIVPDMDFTKPGSVHPPNVIEPIKQFNVTNMFGSPALLKRVGAHADKCADGDGACSIQLPTLKRVISAGAPVPAVTIRSITQMLEDKVQVFTPYGATESLPVACIGSDELIQETAALTDQGRGVCIGKPVDSITTRIIAINDEPIKNWQDARELPQGEIGEICVQGKQVTHAYFNRDISNQLAKISDGEIFWHRMGDLGYFDNQGRLWFCGRKSHRVKAVQGDLYTVQCEAVFNTKVYRTALVGVRLDGQIVPVLCVQVYDEELIVDDGPMWEDYVCELQTVGSLFEHTSRIDLFLAYPRDKSFPVDIRHNSKINREQLAIWAAKKLGGKPA